MTTKQVPRRPFLSTAEAADLLRVCTRTIRRWVVEGRLSPRRTAPGNRGKLLFKRSDLLQAVGFEEDE